MKILFLHLSDCHIRENEVIETAKVEKLVDALNVLNEFDECVIVFTGDLAASGSQNEYKRAKYLIGNIVSKIKEKLCFDKFMQILIVPGNHDANFTSVTRDCNDIQTYYRENTIEEKIPEELRMFDNFYFFSQSRNTFTYDKVCERKLLRLGGFTIQANLINSALFSTLRPDDKEMHYFPNQKLSTLMRNDSADMVITLMHHSTEWFSWVCKRNLEKAIYKNSNILFLGHDHELSTKDLNIDNSDSIFISAGGEFTNKDIIDKSEFNAILLNTSNRCVDAYSFCWNSDESLYIHDLLFKEKPLEKNPNKLTPNKVFIDSIREDQKRKVSKDMSQYFVFPALTGKKKDRYSEKTDINTMEEFSKELLKRKFINIVGEENTGKTTLLKMIYLNLRNDFVPIFFTIDDVKEKNITKIVKFLFEEQYSENSLDYKRFLQQKTSNKVALVDDFDLIKGEDVKDEFLKMLKKEFGYIIITTKNFKEFDVASNVKYDIDENSEFFVLRINYFFLSKRHELIKSVCRVIKHDNDDNIDKIVNTIDGFVKHQFQLFNLDPDFIIQFTQYYLQSPYIQNPKNEAIFNKIFETNIYNALIRYCNVDNIDDTIIALEEIAYYIHFNKIDPLSIADLKLVIDMYNEEYSMRINSRVLVENSIKAKILKYADEFSVRFCNKNHLAFFVARCLNRNYNINGSYKDIEYILDNICFGINDNILLFISYLTSNPRIIMSIFEVATKLMSNWEEFNLDVNNVNFLANIKGHREIESPNNESKKELDEIETKMEEENQQELVIDCKNLYDYDESQIDTIQNKIIRAIKYTEMVSKSLPNFSNILISSNKEKLVNGIYKFPNKILFKILKPVDDKFSEYIQEFKEYAETTGKKNKNGESYTEDDIKQMFHDNAISIVLSFYNFVAYLATDTKSLNVLNNHEFNSINNYIQNLMIVENLGNTESFKDKADDLFDKTKDENVKLMISSIVRKHLIYTKDVKYDIRQHLTDKYFGKRHRKNLLLESYKEKKM